MKFTQYFVYTHGREDRKWIKLEWIEDVVAHPIFEERQKDGRLRRWGKVSDAGGNIFESFFWKMEKPCTMRSLIEHSKR